MRLLSTSTRQLCEFQSADIPPYAILSHTWEEEEVLYADIQNDLATDKVGYAKVVGFCKEAAAKGLEWAWIDTCCIDKTSSAELSEAINSMYQWYANADICIVYLHDFHGDAGDIKDSRWFTRGWTLQELIAPEHAEFYSGDWEEIGSKLSLAHTLSSITGIPANVLRGDRSPSTCSVAQRMSWASERKTTREEDTAYCLLGLFDVNMPLIYGEGRKSFVRLQEQILRQEEDYTIFAWADPFSLSQSTSSGFLASSPNVFSRKFNSARPHLDYLTADTFSFRLKGKLEDTGESYSSLFSFWMLAPDQVTMPHLSSIPKQYVSQQPLDVTVRGLRLTLPVLKTGNQTFPLLAWFYCEMFGRLLCVPLKEATATGTSRFFLRSLPRTLITLDKRILSHFKPEEVFLSASTRAVASTSKYSRMPGTSFIIDPGVNAFVTYFEVSRSRTELGVDSLKRDGMMVKPLRTKAFRINDVVAIQCRFTPNDAPLAVDFQFQVYCGYISGRLWCIIEDRESRDMEADMSFRGDELRRGGRSLLATFSDRAARRSSRLTAFVLAAAVRKERDSRYMTVEFGAWPEDRCPLWVKYCLPDASGEAQPARAGE